MPNPNKKDRSTTPSRQPTVDLMKNVLVKRYFDVFEERQAKLTEECSFKPNLSRTSRFNDETVSPERSKSRSVSEIAEANWERL